MHTSRRAFIARSIASACAVTAATQSSLASNEPDRDKQNEARRIGCLDYGLSFVCNPSPENAVRFWIESRTTVIDERTGISTDFVTEQPTPVIEEDKELCQIHHYSNPISLPAKNTLLAVGPS